MLIDASWQLDSFCVLYNGQGVTPELMQSYIGMQSEWLKVVHLQNKAVHQNKTVARDTSEWFPFTERSVGPYSR